MLNLRNSEVFAPERGHFDIGGLVCEDFERAFGAVDALTTHIDGEVLDLPPAGIDIGSIAQAKLEIKRRGDPNDLRRFVVTDEAAKVVRYLNVDIDRNLNRLPQ